MASTAAATSTPLSSFSSSTHHQPLIDAPPLPRYQSLPTLLPPKWLSNSRVAYCRRKFGQNVAATMATEEAPAAAEVVAETTMTTPEIIKSLQEAWDKVEDKYAVASLVVAGGVALWASAGMIYAIDRLPLIPGVFELVGIGYTGWFAYQNLILKPNREALIQKIKETYKDIIGTN